METYLIAIGYQLLLLKAHQEVKLLVDDPNRDIEHVFSIVQKIDDYLRANPWLQTDPRFSASLTRLFHQIPNHI
jgi:hypothetical protein